MLEKVRPQGDTDWKVLRHHLRNGGQVALGLVRSHRKRPPEWREHLERRRTELLEILAEHLGKKKQDALLTTSLALLQEIIKTNKLENESETQLFIGLVESLDGFLQRRFHPKVYGC